MNSSMFVPWLHEDGFDTKTSVKTYYFCVIT